MLRKGFESMSVNVTEIFGSNVFSTAVMRERLPKGVFREVMDVMKHGGNISMATADIVANAMKDWAVEKGATHYTHWFQPLTGITAEKHDAFITRPEDGKTILQLTGKQLIMGESDASSFPSGGLRSTHYARGYTAWDMTSPAFVKEMTAGTILCIPTIFVSYTGEALDKKTPLLRSMEAINTQGLRILRLFGNTEAQKVFPSVGPEQEYFLVDREKYLKRRDLIYTGRTLDLNEELWKLGIPATTQHNEVAPAQHEMAPIYTMCNLAVDQNQLTMETMKRVATRHGLVCLLHEKPYAGVNGSGKHNNWSIGTDTGENLLDPGDTPNENPRRPAAPVRLLRGQRAPSGRPGGPSRHHLHLPGGPAGERGGSDHLQRRIRQAAGLRQAGLRRVHRPGAEQGRHRPQPHHPLRFHRQQV